MRPTAWRTLRTCLRTDLRSHASAAALLLGLLAGCGGGGGGGGGAAPTASVANTPPSALITLSGPVTAGDSSGDAATFTNSTITLDAGSSKDPEGGALSYRWTVVSKPEGSQVQFAGVTAQAALKADMPGTYVLGVRVTDSRGAFADKQVTLVASSNPPATTLSLHVSYAAAPTVFATRKVALSAIVVLDASGSTDADGDPVTTTWEMIERPAGSRAMLTVDGSTVRFGADVAGLYKVRARGTDPSGAYSEAVFPIEATGVVPRTVITSTLLNLYGSSGESRTSAALGDVVALNGSASRDPEGGSLRYTWILSRQPAGSTARLSAATGEFSQLTPDMMGDYLVVMIAHDWNGGSSKYETTISVNNRRPEAVISSTATPLALPTGPAVRLPVGSTMTLRGGASVDPDGDALVYAWSLADKPAGSTAVLSGITSPNVQLTTDRIGRYQVRLRVTDATGAYSERLLDIDSGNVSPAAVLDKGNVTVLAGSAMTASAALSYDDDDDALSYSWALDARPAGSNATLVDSGTPELSFTPDVAGTFVASVTVSDGRRSGIARVTIKALASTTNSVTLNFAPLEVRYSRGLDRVVAYATNPNALHIIDPFTGVTRQVMLPLPAKSFNLSANGKLAAVLYEGIVSLVDIETATLIHSSLTSGSQTDAFPTNTGVIHMVGLNRAGNTPPVSIVDGRTGTDLTPYGSYYSGHFYGDQRGVVAHTRNKTFVSSTNVSPVDISYFTFDPVSGALASVGDSPYHGGYQMTAPFFLTSNEDLLFTSEGNFYRTDTLYYAGRLSMSGNIVSMSHSAAADEALVMLGTLTTSYGYPPTVTNITYQSSYQRYQSALFLPDTSIALPLIGGEQSYGLNIFHSANGNHVAVVQTGSASKNGTGLKYYVVTR